METSNEYGLTEEITIRIFEKEFDEKYNPETHELFFPLSPL